MADCDAQGQLADRSLGASSVDTMSSPAAAGDGATASDDGPMQQPVVSFPQMNQLLGAASSAARTNQLVLESHHKLLLAAKQNAVDDLENFRAHHDRALQEQASSFEQQILILREELRQVGEGWAQSRAALLSVSEQSETALATLRTESAVVLETVRAELLGEHARELELLQEQYRRENSQVRRHPLYR